MNVFCRLFGHTWVPMTEAPSTRWNTTKDGHILTASNGEAEIRHFQRCRRCDEEKEDPARRFDADGLAAEEPQQESA